QTEQMDRRDRSANLNKGTLEQVGPPRDIYDRPANAFVAGFIGSPRINLVRPTTLKLSERRLGSIDVLDAIAGIRPEDIAVSSSPAESAIATKVYVVEPMGPETWVTVELHGERITGRAPADYHARSGDTAYLRFDEDKVMLFDAGTEERLS